MSRQTLLLLLLSLLTSGCSALTPHKAPTLAQGHIGQVLVASSSLQEGKSLLQHARSILQAIIDTNSEVVRRAESQDFIGAKRRVFDMAEINDPRNREASSAPLGLRDTISKALFHTQESARTNDASGAIQSYAPDIWRKANRILEDAATLSTYINFGLNADSAESLLIIAEEIEDTARQISGQTAVAGGYNLEDMERELAFMLATNNEQLIEADIWYLENFDPIPGTREWAFKPKPQIQRRDIFASDNNNTTGGFNDDDDDDDD